MMSKANTQIGRRAFLLLTAMVAALLLSSTVALAITKTCEASLECFGTNNADTLKGTDGLDRIFGRGGGDTLKGFGNPDELFGQGGPDKLFGGPEADNLSGGPGNDVLTGGEGIDQYFFDNSWGMDSLTEVAPSTNTVVFKTTKGSTVPFTEDLTVKLVSGEGPEVSNSDGTSTVNWEGSVITKVYAGEGDDTIMGNSVGNDIDARSGGDDSISAFGGDDVIHVEDGFAGDAVDCGENFFGSDNDTVYFDSTDEIASNCETRLPAN